MSEKKKHQSRVCQFLAEVLEEEDLTKIKNPIIGVLLGQMIKLLVIIDADEGYQGKVEQLLGKIKERWNG